MTTRQVYLVEQSSGAFLLEMDGAALDSPNFGSSPMTLSDATISVTQLAQEWEGRTEIYIRRRPVYVRTVTGIIVPEEVPEELEEPIEP